MTRTKNLADAYADPTDLNSFDRANPPRNWAGYWADPPTDYPPAVGLEAGYAIPVPNPGGIDAAPPEPETHAGRVARFARDRNPVALFQIRRSDRGPDGWSTEPKVEADARRIADWAAERNRWASRS